MMNLSSKYRMFKSNKFLLIVLLSLLSFNTIISQESRRYKKGFSNELISSFSEFQKDLLKKEQKLWKRHRELIKETLSEIQESIIGDSSINIRERHKNLMKSLTDEQKIMVKKFEERIDTIRQKFYESLSERQKNLVRKKRKRSKRND
jgi:hypothetical protein